VAADFNVFISWSGDQSRMVAVALHEWLPRIIQASRPWMSETDIEKGMRGHAEITRAVGVMKLGIVCLTPDNLEAPWVLFEAGALSKTVDNSERLYTFLISGLEKQDVKPPLSMFQATKAEKEDTRKMLRGLNSALGQVLSNEDLDASFDSMWPRLEEALLSAAAWSHKATPKRQTPEMVAEILELVRGLSYRAESSSLAVQELEQRFAEIRGYYPYGRTYPLSGLLNLGLVSPEQPAPGIDPPPVRPKKQS
jgi:TIR domain